MIEWDKLRPGIRGLAVEGPDDQFILEAFLDGGMRAGLWTDWTAKVAILPANSFERVLNELRRIDLPHSIQIQGLIDRDWRSFGEIAGLQKEFPDLLVLPRVMVDNYLINPDELSALLPEAKRNQAPRLKQAVDSHRDEWVKHGALSQVLYEHGAHQFCRGVEGYPRGLLASPLTDDQDIETKLNQWIAQLDPNHLLPAYRQRHQAFVSLTIEAQYNQAIDGKGFFNQVVVPALNQLFGQQSRQAWLDELLQAPQTCPPDLVDLFRSVLA